MTRRDDDRLRRRIQRACDCGRASCAGCVGAVQRAPRGEPPHQVPASVYDVLRSPGEPLEDATRRQHDRALGHDLRSVRVHTDRDAARAARELRAHAFTFGQHVVLAGDAPHPRSPDGRALLRHELTHAVAHQEPWDAKTRTLGALDLQPADSADEREAQRAGRFVDDGDDADGGHDHLATEVAEATVADTADSEAPHEMREGGS